MINAFFNGSFVPLALMPEQIEKLAKLLPFRYIISFPIETLTTQISTKAVLANFFVEIIWIVMLSVILKIIHTIGIRKYTAVGG